ncbi:toprim domain-containing protein [Eoetvoesiella caeni]
MSYYYKADQVREAIEKEGQWLFVLSHLAPDLNEALKKPGRHVSCPVHGGKHGDGFRLFKDAHLTGGAICNTCGPRHDGFELLMWLRNWSFQDCLQRIGDAIGARRYYIKPTQPAVSSSSSASANPVSNSTRSQASSNQSRGRARANGKLLGCGVAPYKNDPNNEDSFWVSVEGKLGRQFTVWGVDLSRALSEANAEIGHDITLVNHGRKAVTVEQNVRDGQGNIIDVQTITTHRNEWEVKNHHASAHAVASAQTVQYREQSNGAMVQTRQATSEPPVWEGPAVSQLDPADEADNVVPLFKDSAPEWLQQVQDRMERQDKRRKAYGEKVLERHQKVWDDCLPVAVETNGLTPLRSYFEHRGFLEVIPRISNIDSLRFHPSMSYFEENEEGASKEIGKFPTIVAAVQDVDGNLLTLHRTYLSQAGHKAKVREAKKMMMVPDGIDINGAAVRLGKPEDGILGVAEGMETALSAFRATGIPTWSTINAQLMKSFQVPEGVHTVIIWADLDKSRTGQIAANILKTRLEKQGIFVLIMLPQCPIPPRAKSVDWNDILLQQGRRGFPDVKYIRNFCAKNRAMALSKVEYAEALA